VLFNFINISHLHPLLVHLPIGVLIILAVLEFLLRNSKSEESNRILTYVLAFAFLTSLLSLFTGWRLGGEGGYEGDLLRLHKWTAVGLTVSVGLLTILKLAKKPSLKKLYWPLLLIVLALLTITGHYGASMTHGEDFLFEHKEPVHVAISDVSEAMVYADIIRPLFENHCTSCHNTGKANGGLIMTSREALLKGGKSGDFFSLDGKSSALQRVHLPLENKEHMPPNGKLQLSKEQIFYLKWWIANDHCFDCKVKDLNPDERELKMLTMLEEDNSSLALLEKQVEPFSGSWLSELNAKGISAHKLDEHSKLVSVNFSQLKEVTEQQLDLLDQYAENIVEINLGGTDFNDDLSGRLSEYSNLLKLSLANTSVSDKSTSNLMGLEELESLNLYGTEVSIKTLETLRDLENLQQVYVWQTEISKDKIAEFVKTVPSFSVVGQFESPLLAESKLKSPEILGARTLFTDTMEVRLETDFDGAGIFYTLDGTRPDTSSLRFDQKIILEKSSILSAVCYKKDWGTSLPTEKSFKQIKTGFRTAQIIGDPNENYTGKGAISLYDGILGTFDFKDGNWLGFQGVSPSVVLEMKEAKEISNISVGALSSQRSWIFYPNSFTVSISVDGNSWEKVHYSSYSTNTEISETEQKFFDLPFIPVMAKYVRIEVENILNLPDWHASPGESAYVFLDEVLVE